MPEPDSDGAKALRFWGVIVMWTDKSVGNNMAVNSGKAVSSSRSPLPDLYILWGEDRNAPVMLGEKPRVWIDRVVSHTSDAYKSGLQGPDFGCCGKFRVKHANHLGQVGVKI